MVSTQPLGENSQPQESQLLDPNSALDFMVSWDTPTESKLLRLSTSNIQRLRGTFARARDPNRVSQPSSPEANRPAPNQAKLRKGASKMCKARKPSVFTNLNRVERVGRHWPVPNSLNCPLSGVKILSHDHLMWCLNSQVDCLQVASST